MAKEQAIRITAKGEFSQLERGLKNLQGDLKDVLGEINRGARKGGIFDESQIRALDLFNRRFKTTIGDLNREFQKQNDIVDQLYKKMSTSSRTEQDNLKKQINLREKELDVIRRQLLEMEKLHSSRNSEASTYKTVSGGGPSAQSLNDATKGSLLDRTLKTRFMGKFGSLAKGGLALAGIGGLGGMLSQAYQLAYSREVNSLDLSQRIRGSGGFSGSATSMYDLMSATGRRDKMGYTAPETWQFQDTFSRLAGAANTNQSYNLLKFGRGYGISSGEVAALAGQNRQLGGSSDPTSFANMIAASVGQSGMTPRVVEVMESSNQLLQTINTSLKDTGDKQILAYQTVLDTLGNKNGMMKLTGAQGANIIGGFGGIYQPGNTDWEFMGIRALQSYNPKKYGKMGLYGLERTFEDGLQNPDNMPAMLKYMKNASGGDTTLMKRMVQKWLQAGGYNATKTQVDQLYSVTGGFNSFSESNMAKVRATLSGGNAGAKYDAERKDQPGQNVLDVNARYEKSLERVGQDFIDIITKMKDTVADTIGSLEDFEDALDKAADQYLPNWAKKLFDGLGELIGDHPLAALGAAWGARKLGGAAKKALTRKGKKGGGTAEEERQTRNSSHEEDTAGEGRRTTNMPHEDGNATSAASEAKTLAKDASKAGALKKLMKGGGKFLGPIGGFFGLQSWFDGDDQRKLEGDSNWGAFWKSGVDAFNPLNIFTGDLASHVHNSKTGFNNHADMIKTNIQTMKNVNAQAFATAGPNLRKVRLSQANNVWASGLAQLGVNTSTKKGALQGAEVMKYMGFSSDELPKAMKAALDKYGITFDTVGRMTLTELSRSLAGIRPAADTLKELGNKGQISITNLDKIGETQIQKLADQGLIKIQNMGTVSNTTLTSMTTEGKNSLKSLESQGLIAITGFKSDGTARITAMSDEGVKKLKELDDKGVIHITDFQKYSKEKITALSDKGAESLHTLQANGNVSINGMTKDAKSKLKDMKDTTKDDLDAVKKEHSGFKDFFKGLWDDFVKTFKKLWDGFLSIFPDWLTGKGDSSIGTSPWALNGGGSKVSSSVKSYKSALASAGKKYGITDTNLLMAIMQQESGGRGGDPMQASESLGLPPGGINSPYKSIDAGVSYFSKALKAADGDVMLALQAYNYGTGFISYAKKHGGYSPAIAKQYAQLHGGNYGDPNYAQNVLRYYPKQDSYFKGWQNRITSRFGDTSGRSKPHGGLDINGEEGDAVQALAGGKISFLHMDDGGKYDSDHKKNTREGGTEMGIRMPDGSTYFYSHLSKVDPSILKAWESGNHNISIGAGQYVGNVGGDPGMPGSGFGTTGSHLHVGYMNKNGVLQNPETYLRKYLNGAAGDIGDSSIGISPFTGGAASAKLQLDVNLHGADSLSSMQISAIQSVARQVFEEAAQQALSVQPAIRR